MGELLVHGVAEGRLDPSHAVINVTAVARDPQSQHAAMQRTAEICQVIDDAVERSRQAPAPLIRRAETASITTTEEWDHDNRSGQRRRVGFSAERGSRLECAPDADGLTALVSALARDGIRISGPSWHVAADGDGWSALRTSAVADARRRAQAYAAGVGGEVGVVRWIAEPGLRLGPTVRAAGSVRWRPGRA